jgi:hypothetical protein
MTLLLEAVSWSWMEARLMSFQTSSMVLVVLEVRSPRQEVDNGEAEDDEDVKRLTWRTMVSLCIYKEIIKK